MEKSKCESEVSVGHIAECTRTENDERTLGESCNGDDLMVEVLGSEVYVGGVCTSDNVENFDDKVVEAEAVTRRGCKADVVLGSSGNESVCVDGSVVVVASDASELVGGSDDDDNEEPQALESHAVAGSIAVEMEIDSVSNVEMAPNEAVSGKGDATPDDSKQEMEIQEEKVSDLQIVDEGFERESVELGTGLGTEETERDGKVAGDEVGVVKDLTNGSVAILEEAWNPGIGTSSATVEDSGEESRAHEEKSVAIDHEVTNPLDEQTEASDLETDAVDKKPSCGEEKEEAKSEAAGGDSVDKQVVVESEVTVAEIPSVSDLDEALSIKPEEFFANNVAGDTTKEESNAGQEMKALDIAELVDSDGREDIAEPPGTTEHLKSEDHHREEDVATGDVFLDSAERANGVVVREETSNVQRVSDSVDIAPMDADEVMVSDTENPETNQELNNEGCLDNDVTTNSDVSQRNVSEPNNIEKEIVRSESLDLGSSSSVQKPSYELPPEHEGVFSVPDLVWGKVKSHPWWPGQIFDFTDASDKAMKHHKKDCLLVAYFGDRTFAWNEESTLKSFRSHFSQMVAQSNGDTFHKAVSCALEEVSRRVELSLACSCIAKESYDNIRVQVVESAGIRSESTRREGVDESLGVSFFRADKLIDYIKALAQRPFGRTNDDDNDNDNDDLGLTIAKAQLQSFGRFKGYCSLPEFQFCGDLSENDTAGPRIEDIHLSAVPEHKDEETSSSQETKKGNKKSSLKRKHNLRDGIYPKVKEKSLSELMSGGVMDYPDDDDHVPGKRWKNSDNHADDVAIQDGRKTVSLTKISAPPKQSFKIGECMRRVASQMTGSPSVKGNAEKGTGGGDKPGDGNEVPLPSSEGRAVNPTDYSSLNELLLQLQLIARDPRKEYNFSNVIVNFFSDFRNSVIGDRPELVSLEKAGIKRKKGAPETFEFDDMNDTYWTDRVIQNGVDEQQQQQQQPRKSRKKDNQLSISQPEKTSQESRRPYNRKRYSNGDHLTVEMEKPLGYISENAPAELIMNFSEVRSVPTESNLNKMFRRFGPLKEAETEVDVESSRARVIFKKCSDAEVAFNSAGKFSIFGPTLVNYQLNYTPTVQFKPVPLLVTLDQEMQLDLSAHDHEMQLDLSTHEHEMHLDLSGHDHEMELDLSNLSTFEVNLI